MTVAAKGLLDLSVLLDYVTQTMEMKSRIRDESPTLQHIGTILERCRWDRP